MEAPKTLMEAIKFFSDPDRTLQFFAAYRWPNGVECPYCAAEEPMFLATRRVWKCRKCRKQFSAKLGTIFNESPIGLDKWMTAAWLIANCKNGVSSYEIARDLGVTQKTAWFMLSRLRHALQDDPSVKLSGEVEVDESFIGGKSRNMHASKREKAIQGLNKGKTIAFGMVERGGNVRTKVVERRRKAELQAHIRENGTYICVEPFHLFRYLDEQAFRYNNRKATDSERFQHVCRRVVGRRITWKELTGKDEATA